ncbi:MAG: hypothetical protein M3314_05955 [Actinomycetota bacterium]|nr:hypothetical protein [Actinomycetota bacterium]
MSEITGGRPTGLLSDCGPVRLADGVELLGQYKGSGCTEAPYLIRCSDGRTVQVSWLLHELVVALDRERRPRELAAMVSARTGRTLTTENVAFLIDQKLRPLGLVADPTGSPARRRPASSALALSVRTALIPAAVVRALSSLLRPLFLPPVVIATLVGLGAVDVWLGLRGGVAGSLATVAQRPELVLLVALLTLLGAAFHEFGHATGSRYGGAEPGVIGVGVYLFWPVFFNDLNDSYRLSRRDRLRADLGGVYFNALFILVAAGAYAVSGFEPLLAVVAVQHLTILQQFLPFVRLDGYYVVSDLAGVPDLFRFVKPILSGLVPGRRRSPALEGLRRGPRLLVTAWILATVPLLVAGLVWFIVRMPHLLTLIAETAVAQGQQVAAGWRLGAPHKTGLAVLQLVLLVLPLVGITAAGVRALRNCYRHVEVHRKRSRGGAAFSSSLGASGAESAGLAEGAGRSSLVDDLDPADRWLSIGSASPGKDWADELDPADVWIPRPVRLV